MAVSEATDTDVTPPAPPGLHEAADENRECGNCVFFRESGNACTKFPPLCVSSDWLCGAWKAGRVDTEDETPAKSSARTVRQAGRGALARINARNRPQP